MNYAPVRHRQHTSTVLAGMFGNILEWYDFALYGFLAVILSELFFAPNDPVTALLGTYGVFAAGFLMRPLGAWLFGYIGDVFSRRKALLLSVVLMAVATTLLGILPTYALIGVWAPILLVVLRLLQGLSVGGEFSTSVTYLVERAPQKQRGLFGSFANIGSMCGMLLGAGVAALTTTLLTHESVLAWGWRLPFLFGGVLGLIAILLRSKLPANVIHTQEERHRTDTPLKEALTNNKSELAQALMFSLGYAVLFYIALVYLPTYANEFLNIPLNTALQINTAAIALATIFIPLSGYISDKLIRRRTLIIFALSLAIFGTIPLFILLSPFSVLAFALVQCTIALVVAILLGTAPAMYVELFPKSDRLTAYSMTFNISLGVFGGTTPLVATYLIKMTDNNLMPAVYLVLTSTIALVAMFIVRDRSREKLR